MPNDSIGRVTPEVQEAIGVVLADIRLILSWAMRANIVLRTGKSGGLLIVGVTELPREISDACERSGAKLAEMLEALHAATPLVAQAALWWELAYTQLPESTRVILEEHATWRKTQLGSERPAAFLALADMLLRS